MIKISEENEVSIKEFQKLKGDLSKIEKALKEQINSLNKALNEKVSKTDKNLKDQINKLNNSFNEKINKVDDKLNKNVNLLNKTLKDQTSSISKALGDLSDNFKNKSKSLTEEISSIRTQIEANQKQIKELIKAQETVLTNKINELNEDIALERKEIDEIRATQDVLKQSIAVNEEQMIEKIEAMIHKYVRMILEDKEREILMKFWIDELKEIVKDFEKLKNKHPKEFSIDLDKIIETIEVFKQKINM